MVNPSYYNVEDTSPEGVNTHLSQLIEKTLRDLERSGCIEIDSDKFTLRASTHGLVSSYYYLSHETVGLFNRSLASSMTERAVHELICDAKEFDELPVRHNEDAMNAELSEALPWKVDPYDCGSPHAKTNLLLQAHFSRMAMPISDYYTDLKTVLDSAVRIFQAMVDIAAEKGLLSTSLQAMTLVQAMKQARWPSDNPLTTLPGIEPSVPRLDELPTLPQLVAMSEDDVQRALSRVTASRDASRAAAAVVAQMPITEMTFVMEPVEDVREQFEPVRVNGRGPEPMSVRVQGDTLYEIVVDLKRRSRRGATDLGRRVRLKPLEAILILSFFFTCIASAQGTRSQVSQDAGGRMVARLRRRCHRHDEGPQTRDRTGLVDRQPQHSVASRRLGQALSLCALPHFRRLFGPGPAA